MSAKRYSTKFLVLALTVAISTLANVMCATSPSTSRPPTQASARRENTGSSATVWATGDTRKVLPADLPETYNYHWSAARQEVRLHGARNEFVPFQIVITAHQPLADVDITPGPFTGPSSVFTNAITIYRQAYYTVTANSDPWGYGVPPAHLPPGPTPDGLIPFTDPYDPAHRVGAPFDVPAGRSQPVWVDVTVPPGTAPGNYTATFTVTVSGQTLTTLDVALHVWNFTLPDRPALIVFIPADPMWTIPPQYNLADDDRDAILALADKMNQALFAHRLIPGTFFRTPTVSESNSTLLLDFTAADAELSPYVTAGLPLFFVPNPWDDEVERYPFHDDQGRFYTAAAFDDPLFVDKVTQYYTALRDHYTALGWFDEGLAYPIDETQWVADEPLHNGPAGFQRLRDWAQVIKTVDPDFRVSASSVLPIPPGPPERGWIDLTNLIDNWEVVADEVDIDPALFQARQILGETVSTYFNDYGDLIDYKAILHRALTWHAYVHNIYSIGGWAAAAWVDDDLVSHNPWTTAFNGIYGHGGGALFWPGYHIEGNPVLNVDGPLPSLRLKLAREAIEDTDYLILLADRTSNAYARDVAQTLIADPLFQTDFPPAAFYAQRDWIGALLSGETTVSLTTLTGTVTDTTTGTPVAGALIRAAHTAARTAASGTYTLTLAADEPLVTISHDRYFPRALPPTGPTLDVALIPLPTEVAPLFSFESAAEVGQWEYTSVISAARVSSHATDGTHALRVVFDDNPAEEAEMGTWQFTLTDWRGYTALEFDVYNEGPYYTGIGAGVAGSAGGWYPQTGGTTTLLPNSQTHVVIPMANVGRDVDLSAIEELSIALDTVTEEEDYTGKIHLWPLGQRTLYVDNVRLVRVTGFRVWLPLILR